MTWFRAIINIYVYVDIYIENTLYMLYFSLNQCKLTPGRLEQRSGEPRLVSRAHRGRALPTTTRAATCFYFWFNSFALASASSPHGPTVKCTRRCWTSRSPSALSGHWSLPWGPTLTTNWRDWRTSSGEWYYWSGINGWIALIFFSLRLINLSLSLLSLLIQRISLTYIWNIHCITSKSNGLLFVFCD